jgi:hypothetical protein
MRTTIELPDELLEQARGKAALSGISLQDFFIDAVKQKLEPPAKTRRPIPVIEGIQRIGILTPQQLDEAMFGALPDRIDSR